MKFILTFTLAVFAATLFAQGKDFSYTENNTPLKGYFAKAKKKSGKKVPGVVILHAWMGLKPHEKNTADLLAAMGYHAFAADVYGEANRPTSIDEAKKASGYYKDNVDRYHARIRAAIDELVKLGADSNNIAVIGYCFGGTGAIEAARCGLPVKGVVSFHGGLGKDAARAITPISAKVLVLHGADDPFVPEAQIKTFQDEMRASKADWQMVYYANAVHSFTEPGAGNDNSKGAAYNEKAAKRSWEHMKQFLGDLFKK